MPIKLSEIKGAVKEVKEQEQWIDKLAEEFNIIADQNMIPVSGRTCRMFAMVSNTKALTLQGQVVLDFDREKLAKKLCEYRGGHNGFPPAEWDYDEADFLRSSIKEILVVVK